MKFCVAILGLGEAGGAFARAFCKLGVSVRGWDPQPKQELPAELYFAASNAEAARGSELILSVNDASQSQIVARELLPILQPSQCYADLNTASPAVKRQTYEILKPSGVAFADVAIMAPVPPLGLNVPFLASGAGAAKFAEQLAVFNLNITVLAADVGAAATRKLLRSMVYKGVAAVILEALQAAQAFELEDFMREQIGLIIGKDERLLTRLVQGSHQHAQRRTLEMQAVAVMLAEHALAASMTKAAAETLQQLCHKKNTMQ